MKYVIHETGVSKFFRFQNLVFSCGYLEKKYCGKYARAGGQCATVFLSYVQAK